jgi:tetratricopeptide (TPR) repeat protein
MNRILLLTLMLYSLINFEISSQTVSEQKKSFYYAESRVLFEDFKEALPQYEALLKKYPDNANYKYRIGQCYLNMPGEKEKSIKYLEDAVKYINPGYNQGKFSEKGSPYDALDLLANAYMINNQLDKAIDIFKIFKQNINNKVYDTAVVNMQIRSCFNAKEMMKAPVYLKSDNSGNTVNGKDGEFYPVISDNEEMIVFARSEAFYDAILYSVKKNGTWSEPQNMNEILKVDRDIYPTSLSADGKDLYLYSAGDLDGTIFTTRFENNTWTPLVRLNDNINTKYWESHASISHDNQKLYFTSNRKGGLGGLDIYVSDRDNNGDWGTAVNLGPIINTKYNEESPFLLDDDKTLFFSSRGHFNIGGYDIFYSSLQPNGEWSIPLNAGYPLNTTDDDVFFKPMNDGNTGYMALYSPDGFGKQDIYHIEIYSSEHPRKFFIEGNVKVQDLRPGLFDSVKIIVTNNQDPSKKFLLYSNPKTGSFGFEVPQGNYDIAFEADGGQKTSKTLDLPLKYPTDSIFLAGTILPKSDNLAELSIKGNKNITVTKGDPIDIPLKVEPNSVLTVEHWSGKKLLSTNQYSVDDSTFTYKIAPEIGENRVTFRLTDKFNNTANAELFINRNKIFSELPFVTPKYTGQLTPGDLAAFMEILKKRANERMLNVINEADTTGKKFRNPDDLLALLRDGARKKNISPEEVDKLALEVAVKDNILTQAAVDLLAHYADGELKQLLSNLDIYKEGLKTWTDLLDYISSHSSGRINPRDLNALADAILTGTDKSIAIIKEKILAYGENYKDGDLLRQSVTTTDQGGIKVKEQWLRTFYNESLRRGLTDKELNKMLAAISSFPGTDSQQYLRDLIEQSGEPLTTALKSLDLSREKIKSPEELLGFLISNTDKEKYPEDAVFKSIADLIIANNIPDDMLSGLFKGGRWGFGSKNMISAISALAGIILLLFFLIWRRKRKNKKE